MNCPKCNSNNVLIQNKQVGTIGTARTNYKSNKRHGLFYWILFGWWIWMFKLLFLPITIWFGRKKKVGRSTTINASKTINKTIAICQNCGNTWNI